MLQKAGWSLPKDICSVPRVSKPGSDWRLLPGAKCCFSNARRHHGMPKSGIHRTMLLRIFPWEQAEWPGHAHAMSAQCPVHPKFTPSPTQSQSLPWSIVLFCIIELLKLPSKEQTQSKTKISIYGFFSYLHFMKWIQGFLEEESTLKCNQVKKNWPAFQ